MALTGQLSDMSLAELIEFFCNQRKTGRLKVDYHRGHGVFFIKEGELVDAKVGQLSGSEALYFALTLPNAAFDFSPEVQPTRRTINEAWTQVVLEGLRRLDEGLSPTESDAFGGWTPSDSDLSLFMDQVDRLGEGESKVAGNSSEAAPFSMMVEDTSSEGSNKKKFMLMGAAACVVLAVGVAAIPLMSGSSKSAAGAAPQAAVSQPEASSKPSGGDAESAPAASDSTAADASVVDTSAAEREREERLREQRLREQRERRAEEARRAGAAQDPNAAPAASSGPKSVRVTVTYDEAGRVTAASVAGASPGAEAFASNALRAARGKRFPAGKAGSAVVTIPVN